MSTTRRRSILIDQQVQGALIRRVIMYWFYCLLSVTLMVFCWSVFHGPRRPLGLIVADLLDNFAPALIASLILLPIVMVDIVRFSNTFVGPIYRLKSGMHHLAGGESVQPLSFRDGDYWPELAVSFNRLLVNIQPTPDGAVPNASETEERALSTVCTATADGDP